jgi:hypothetical protein
MKRELMLQHLQRWERVVLEVQEVDEALEALTGREPEGRLTTAMWATVGAYSEILETLLIGSAVNNWLEWYWIENQMGERAFSVVLAGGERPIDCIEALTDMLMECRA